MDIQKVRIYEIALTRKNLDYAVAQRFHRSRDHGILLLMDTEPAVHFREIKRECELNEYERRWACDAIMAIMGEGTHGDKYQQFYDFLDRLEKELDRMEYKTLKEQIHNGESEV